MGLRARRPAVDYALVTGSWSIAHSLGAGALAELVGEPRPDWHRRPSS